MEEKDWLTMWSTPNQIQKVIETNQYTERFGLVLSEEDAELLVQERRNCLKEQQRVEFGEGILTKIICTFCDSPYIQKEEYAATVARLQDIFYLYKNESLDELTDDELLAYMKEKFDEECEGDLEYLESTVLEEFARKIRSQTTKYIGRYRREDV